MRGDPLTVDRTVPLPHLLKESEPRDDGTPLRWGQDEIEGWQREGCTARIKRAKIAASASMRKDLRRDAAIHLA